MINCCVAQKTRDWFIVSFKIGGRSAGQACGYRGSCFRNDYVGVCCNMFIYNDFLLVSKVFLLGVIVTY